LRVINGKSTEMADKNKAKNKEGEMSFLEHLEELRWVILHSVIAIVACMFIALFFKSFLFDTVILGPTNPDFWTNRMLCRFGELINKNLCVNSDPTLFNLINIKMAGQLTVHFAVAIVAGLILATPYVVYQFWTFLRPALHENEKKSSRGAVFVISGLFILGVLFGYFLLVPLSIHFLTSYNVSDDVVNQINIRSYISTISGICLATGIIFELPVLAFFLTKIGVLTPEFMIKYRKHAIILIVILSAIITPPDVFSQCLVAIPILILYEVSIKISARIIKKRERAFNDMMEEDTSELATTK
jgi:sec-independent protein translocase protein TatC